MDNEILISKKPRGELLESLYAVQQGIDGMLANTKQ